MPSMNQRNHHFGPGQKCSWCGNLISTLRYRLYQVLVNGDVVHKFYCHSCFQRMKNRTILDVMFFSTYKSALEESLRRACCGD
jgi:hypothetical protein